MIKSINKLLYLLDLTFKKKIDFIPIVNFSDFLF